MPYTKKSTENNGKKPSCPLGKDACIGKECPMWMEYDDAEGCAFLIAEAGLKRFALQVARSLDSVLQATQSLEGVLHSARKENARSPTTRKEKEKKSITSRLKAGACVSS